LLIKQVQYYENDDKRLELAKEFVSGAADNIYRNLRYYNSRGKDLDEHMSDIDSLRKQIPSQSSINSLMGIEGNIHKVYYKTWPIIINQEIEFEKRVKRPPDNIINTLISYVNSLIYTTVLSQIYHTQLNPTISYLHAAGNKRFSLSLDIAEIFKPLIGDRMIFSLLNKNQIQEKHFTKELNYLHLTKEGSQIIMEEYDKRLKTVIKHKDLNREVSYKYLIRLEAYKLIKHLIGEKEYSSFRIWW
jgi:CRISPR-associated protein Cas1